MQLHQLEYLVAVVDEGGFTAAATRLRVAQPGVSAQVRKLERELGHPLIDRSVTPVRPTAVGVDVVAAARRALDAVAGVRRTVEALDGLLGGSARAGTVGATPGLDVVGVLADFAAAHPGVRCSLTEARSDALLAMLRDGRLDVALVGAARSLPDDLEAWTVSEEPLVVVVPPDHPLAGAERVVPGDLAGRDVVVGVEGNALRDAFDRACAGVDPAPRVASTASDPTVLARLCARGLGAAVLPSSLSVLGPAERGAAGLTVRPFDAAGVTARLVLARPRLGASPAGEALARALLDACADHAAGSAMLAP